MSVQESSGYCDYCLRPVLGRRETPNHLIHFLITFFSCGLWGIVWLLCWWDANRQDYACPTCGSKMREGRAPA